MMYYSYPVSLNLSNISTLNSVLLQYLIIWDLPVSSSTWNIFYSRNVWYKVQLRKTYALLYFCYVLQVGSESLVTNSKFVLDTPNCSGDYWPSYTYL